MANTYKNIVITPNRDTLGNVPPVIRFSGGDTTSNTDMNVRFYTTSNGTLSFEGSAGQLFSITNDLTNSIFSVNDISGIPSIDVYANGDILLAPFDGNVKIGTGNTLYISNGNVGINTLTPAANLNVIGNANITTELLVAGMNIVPTIQAAFAQANTGGGADTVARNTANEAFIQANTARTHANNAFSTANAALSNTSGVSFDGNLNVTGNLVANVLASSNGYIDLGPGNRPSYLEGRIYYDNIDKSLTVYNNDAGFILPIGQKEYVKVWNDSGATIEKGKPVYASGFHAASHHHLSIALADASDINKFDVIGLAGSNIANNDHGYVITRGWIGGINTASLTVSQRFHLGYSEPGALVTSAPQYPNYPYDIGFCVVSDSANGYLYIDRQSHTFEGIRVLESARVGGDLTVEGNFTVLGSENAITVNSLEVGTQFIYLGSGDSISNANINFTGTGLNDLEFRGHYTGSGNTKFYVTISDVSPDKFTWSYLSDFSVPEQSNVTIQFQTAQALSNGISVYFNANTGHTLGDKWNATAFGVSADFGFVGNHIDGPNGYTHSGIFRDASDGTYKFFRSYDPEIEGNINTANATFAYANVQVEKITASQVYEGSTKILDVTLDALSQANTARDHANTAHESANAGLVQANTARTHANVSFDQANTARTHANTAHESANAGLDQANTARTHANNSYNQANLAFAKANSTTYTSNVVISVTDNTNAALRITQTGTGEALRVEDDTNPDASPFVVLATGNVGIGTTNPVVPLQANGMLLVTLNGASPLSASGEIAEFIHNANSYVQVHVRNANTGTLASGDLVVTADIGTDTTEFIDLGINNSNYADPNFTINNRLDGYLYTSNGNLAIGVANTTKSVTFFTGGLLAANERMRIDPSGNLLIGRTNSTVGNNVKLDANGAINVSSLLVNGVDTISSSFAQANTARTHANNAYDKANSANVLASTASINFIIDGGGSAITTGEKGHLEIPFNCTITQWTVLLDQTGSLSVQIWKDTYANFPPTNADSINASPLAVSSGVKNQGTTLTTTTITAGDILAYNVVSATTTTRATIALEVIKT